MAREWKVGDIVPFAPRRGIVDGPEIEPEWYCLVVPPHKERATKEFLKERHGIHSFFPTETRKRFYRGKKIVTDHPTITRMVYARFTQAPQWDVMKEQQRLIAGVFSVGDTPLKLPRDVIRRLQGLKVEADLMEEARQKLMRLAKGDKVKLGDDNPLSGFTVDVTEIRGAQVFWQIPFMERTINGSSKLADVQKHIPQEDLDAALDEIRQALNDQDIA